MKALAIATLVLSAVSTAILVRFAQKGLELQGAAEEVKKNPLKTIFSLFSSKPAAP